jgi:hypothetical protein
MNIHRQLVVVVKIGGFNFSLNEVELKLRNIKAVNKKTNQAKSKSGQNSIHNQIDKALSLYCQSSGV